MPALTITLDIEETPWSDLGTEVRAQGLGKIVRIGRLPGGMTSGKSSVTVLIQMPDGRLYAAETSMALFLGSALALKARDDEMSGANARN